MLLAPATGLSAPGELSARERDRLERGRIVRRPLEEPRRGLVGGSSWIVVAVPVHELWRMLNSIATYRLMFPGLDRIDVVEEEGPRRVVKVTQDETLVALSYHVAMHFDDRRREIRFRLDRAHDNHVRDGWGFLRLDPEPGHAERTMMSFGAVVDPGDDPLLRDLFDARLERRMLNVPRRIKRWVERGRALPELERRPIIRAHRRRVDRARRPLQLHSGRPNPLNPVVNSRAAD